MVLDYLETRDAKRKVRAPEPGSVGTAGPEASDRTVLEPTVEAARLVVRRLPVLSDISYVVR